MTPRHYHLYARTRYGHRRLIAEARSAELAWRWYDRWQATFAARGELLMVQAVEGEALACLGRTAAAGEEEGA